MNLRQRYLKAIKGQTVDRVPLSLDGFHYEGTGHSIRIVQGNMETIKPFGFIYRNRDEITQEEDVLKRKLTQRIYDKTCSIYNLWSFISRDFITPSQFKRKVKENKSEYKVETHYIIDTPKGALNGVFVTDFRSRTNWTKKYYVEGLDDIKKIKSLKWEFPEPLNKIDLSLLPSNFNERGILQTAISAPSVCVAGLMSYTYFLELCATELRLLEELTDECYKRVKKILTHLIEDKQIDIVWLGGSEWLTPPMGSPEIYDKLVNRYQKELVETIHSYDVLCHLHCHGNVRSVIEKVIENKADFFEPVESPPNGDIEFEEAKKIVNGTITLGGNLQEEWFKNKTESEIEKATREIFKDGKKRIVLKPSYSPTGKFTTVMFNNYNKMIDVWEELSAIDNS
jgi:hypothetical protein